jgi:S-DNA-T family DNA segregation ATPase FtsK/SpoIIIE
MDHCDRCRFTYADHRPPDLAGEIHALGARYGAVLADRAVDGARLTSRPAPGVWSPVEYGCHVRDVLLAQRERLLLALVENEPTFAPIYRDQRAGLARYGDEAPGQVAGEITFAADLLAWVLTGLGDPEWDRTCIYNFPEPSRRTVAWLAQHTLHEGEHHLLDIERGVSPGDPH